MPWSFSNAIIAPLVIVPDAPTLPHALAARSGVLGYRQEKLPFGGSTAAASCAAAVRPGALAAGVVELQRQVTE